MDMDTTGLFYRHCRALFQKRAMNFKRDKKAWCSSTILPSLFVFLGLLTFKFASPSRELGALTLTLKDYNPEVNESPRNPIPFNNRTYMCQPGECLFGLTEIQESDDQVYSYCGRSAWIANKSNETCTITQSIDIMAQITEDGAEGTSEDVSTITTSANALFNSSLEFIGTQYGALYFTHDSSSQTSSLESYGNVTVAACEAYYTENSVANYTDISQCEYYRGIAYVVSYNFTALHSSLLYQAVADEAIVNEAMGGNDKYSITATVHPLPFTALEKNFNAAEDSFTTWFLIVLSFPFIAGSFGSFVVAERLSKAKHLQTVAGVKPSAYWLSTYVWDVLNYQLPMWITVILIYSFSLTTFTTTKGDVSTGVITTMFLFGPAGAGFTYCISFLFKSPSMCNLFIIIFNFMIGFAGPLVTFVLELIGKGDPGNRNEKLLTVSTIIKWVLRPVPSFCLGDALFRSINLEEYRMLEEDPKLTVWDPPMLLWDVIFLILESILYLLLAILIDKWSTNPRIITMFKNICTCKCLFGTKPVNEGITAALPDDDDVVAEAERVSSGDAIDDMIVVKNLTKQYPNGKLAVNNVSYGIPRGECFGLLGINGAGKTSTMAMLTAEFPPTTGDATLSSFSVTNEPEKTRQRIGYCPQFDAHFMNMTGREHVEMYASIKGIALDVVKEAAKSKLAEVGLSELDSDRLSMGYSGGMKRKLSVACATIGQPQIVFLDEPSTGMDPVARRDMWEVISRMVIGEGLADEEKTSVILTTHSMEEAEALCPRIAIMANGKLRCVGSAQHLKTRFGQGYQVELKVKDVKDSDEDFKLIVAKLLHSRGSSSSQELVVTAGVEEGATKFEDIFLNLYQARHALGVLTGDDYLSSMLTATDPTGYVAWKSASTTVGIPLDELTDFAAEELRMKSLKEFIETTYANTTLRERQDNKVRYEVGSKDLRISSLFATIEENKEKLLLSDYGISQTSLEQVFNMHAAEAEKLKQGTNDA